MARVPKLITTMRSGRRRFAPTTARAGIIALASGLACVTFAAFLLFKITTLPDVVGMPSAAGTPTPSADSQMSIEASGFSLGDADKSDSRPRAGTRIPGKYIVVLKDTPQLHMPGQVTNTAQDLAQRSGGQLGPIYGNSVHGFSISVSESVAQALAKDPRVAYVQQDSVIRTTSIQPNSPWNLDRIDQFNPALSGTYSYSSTASNVSIYVIDTGIRFTHTEFGGRVRNGPASVDNNDCAGHGTAVAGAAAATTFGVAKMANLYALRIFDCEGVGAASDGIAAIDWVTANAKRPAVANISWISGPNSPLDDAVRRSINSGVTYVIAGGNSDADSCDASPQRVAEAITVGATDPDDRRTSWSNWGACVDLFAPGTDIRTTTYTSDTAVGTASGTSLSSPIVAGAAALYLADHPSATPQQVRDALVACAASGVISTAGADSPNKLVSTTCNRPITLANPGRQLTIKGQAVDLQMLKATTTNSGTSMTYSAAELPAGLSIDPATGTIAGTPTTMGTSTVTAADSSGASASGSFDWQVIGCYGPITGVNGMCVDDRSSGTANGNAIQLWGCNQGVAQLWKVRSDNRLEVLGKCMTISNDATADGTPTVLYDCGNAVSQIWKPQANGTLLNPASGKCLNAPNSGWGTQLTIAACVDGTNQRWNVPHGVISNMVSARDPGIQATLKGTVVYLRIVASRLDTTQTLSYRASGLPAGLSIDSATGMISGTPTSAGVNNVTATITDRAGVSASVSFLWEIGDGPIIGLNGMCVDDRSSRTDNGNPIQMWGCNRGGAQLWTLHSDSTLVVLGKCMTISNNATADGTPIGINDCRGAASQIWQPHANGALLNQASGKCLKAPDAEGGTQLTLDTCTGEANQAWRLPTPRAVSVTNPGAQMTVRGAPVDLRINARTTNTGQSLTYRASGLPAGLSINATTGAVSGAPTTTGITYVTIIATDGTGATDAAAFVWRIAHGPIIGVNDMCVDDRSVGTANGNAIQLWGCNQTAAQVWTVRSDNSLEVLGKCMTISNDATADGTAIVLYDCRSAGSQIWQPQDNGTLLNLASGKCLNAPNSGWGTQLTIATCTTGTNQRWRLPTTPTVNVTNPGNQTTMVGATVSLRIIVGTNTGNTLIHRATGLPAGLSIDATSGMIAGTPTTAGTSNVTVTAVDSGGTSGSASFVWQVFNPGIGPIIGVGGMCVDDRSSGTANGNAIQLWGCNQGAAQLWKVRSDNRLEVLGKSMSRVPWNFGGGPVIVRPRSWSDFGVRV